MAAHGCPRATGDIDFWVRASPENAARLYGVLTSFGAPLEDVSPQDFETPGIFLQIGVAPRRIDILTDVSGLTFEKAWERKVSADLEGISAPVLGHDDLIQNKIASGRPKDLIDVQLLESKKDKAGE